MGEEVHVPRPCASSLDADATELVKVPSRPSSPPPCVCLYLIWSSDSAFSHKRMVVVLCSWSRSCSSLSAAGGLDRIGFYMLYYLFENWVAALQIFSPRRRIWEWRRVNWMWFGGRSCPGIKMLLFYYSAGENLKIICFFLCLQIVFSVWDSHPALIRSEFNIHF